MKIVLTYLISLVGIISFSSGAAMQEQSIKVRVQVRGDRKIKFLDVPLTDLSRHRCLGIAPSWSEIYFPVVAARYEDILDVHGCARMKKDLVTDIPYSIQQEERARKTVREQDALKKSFLFPQYISESFIHHVNQGNNERILYQKRNKIIKARYEIELVQAKKAEPIVPPIKEVIRNNYQIPPLFNKDDNFMGVAAVCAFLLFILGQPLIS